MTSDISKQREFIETKMIPRYMYIAGIPLEYTVKRSILVHSISLFSKNQSLELNLLLTIPIIRMVSFVKTVNQVIHLF